MFEFPKEVGHIFFFGYSIYIYILDIYLRPSLLSYRPNQRSEYTIADAKPLTQDLLKILSKIKVTFDDIPIC